MPSKVIDPPLPLSPALLDRPVAGFNLEPMSFREALAGGPTLVVFLRHFG